MGLLDSDDGLASRGKNAQSGVAAAGEEKRGYFWPSRAISVSGNAKSIEHLIVPSIARWQ